MRKWKYADTTPFQSVVITPNGDRIGPVSPARARGIAAAMNTPEGKAAFEKARNDYSKGLN